MFLDNKYTRWYFSIVSNAKQDINNYFEKHHIIPKCMGGSNDCHNMVKLTAREHFICHLLLIRMTDKIHRSKLVYAAWQQSRSAKFRTRVVSRHYETLRRQLSESYRGIKRKPFTEKTRTNMSASKQGHRNNMYGKNHTETTKAKISSSKRGKLLGEENPFFGKTHSQEVIRIIATKSSEKQKGVPKQKSPCPNCGLPVAANIMKRFHGDKCKRVHPKT